ncbi:MAG: serine hydrolase domain-containing protein [Longimicrobiales bacterium]|nr:serine hydrolase domain-containing protein [Longimicrobiales bacterium]
MRRPRRGSGPPAAILPLAAALIALGAPASVLPLPPGLQPARVLALSAQETGVPETPTEAGFDPGVLARLDAFVDSAVADGVAPGATIAIGRADGFTWIESYGVLDTVGAVAGVPTSSRTIWDLASLTKVIGTTTAVMLLVDEGRLSLDDRVVTHLPTWAAGDPRKGDVTIRHLLTHRAGLAPFRRWYLELEGREAIDRAIDAEPLEAEPGTRERYSDIGAMTLARVVEAVSGTSLDTFLRERLFIPLGMRDTHFTPPASLRDRIAPTELDTIYRGYHLHGEVHDENAHAYGGVAGHAGLFSTAEDLARFARLFLREGVADDGTRLLEAATVRDFVRRVASTSSRALGWDTPSGPKSSAGEWMTSRAFGHTGFTGTSIWIDPELDLFVIVLTNRVNPTRENTRHASMRREVANLAVQALIDREVIPREGAGG